MIFQHFCALVQSRQVPRSAEPEHWHIASHCCTSNKRVGLVAQTFSETLGIEVLQEGFDGLNSLQACHFRSAAGDAVELIDTMQATGLCWIAWRTNGNKVFIVSPNLSLNTRAIKA